MNDIILPSSSCVDDTPDSREGAPRFSMDN
jgi:hypothetical protein